MDKTFSAQYGRKEGFCGCINICAVFQCFNIGAADNSPAGQLTNGTKRCPILYTKPNQYRIFKVEAFQL